MPTLYRTYRPKTFKEIEGQQHVVKTLAGALSTGTIGHAYLFTGPRGTGKTTMARLLAKSLLCFKRGKNGTEPCNDCANCNEINEGRSLNIVEIDAASNRGIDEIRSIKESAGVAAASGGYKVFIIDEVHMLTTPAFNALLKTLEEPPSHVVFVLATTEAHKLPDTVLSRVQRFDFKKLSQDTIAGKLAKIAKAEKLTAEPSALQAIAFAAAGSVRDAESLFAKAIAFADGAISVDHVRTILGLVPIEEYHGLLDLIVQKKRAEAVAAINRMFDEGIDLDNFIKQFIIYLRDRLVEAVQSKAPTKDITPAALVTVITAMSKAQQMMKTSPIPQLPLELAIIELTVV